MTSGIAMSIRLKITGKMKTIESVVLIVLVSWLCVCALHPTVA